MNVQPFDFSVDLMRSILWQYEQAPKAIQLSRNDQDFIDSAHSEFWDNWIRDVFDLTTANEFGLSVWARILNVSIKISEKKNITDVFGFGVENKNFNNGGFGIGQNLEADLDIESARKILRLRWFQLTMRPTVPNINSALIDVFGQGAVYVVDSYDMSYSTFFFAATPDYKIRRLLENTDILPRPSTVGARWQVQAREAFGFGIYHLNFENGSFGA